MEVVYNVKYKFKTKDNITKDEFKKVNNDIVRELKLGSSFCI